MTPFIQRHFWFWFGGIWLTVGLAFLLLAGFFLREEQRFTRDSVTAEGTVLAKHVTGGGEDGIQHSVTYRFTTPGDRGVEGRSEVSEEAWYGLAEGGPVRIEYLPDRPQVSRVAGTGKTLLLLVFAIVGSVMSLAGGTILAVAAQKRRTRRRLLASGVAATAVVVDVSPTTFRINGRPQWRLTYEYRDYASQPHRGSLHVDADDAASWKPGDAGRVMFDPNRPSSNAWMGRERAPLP